MIHSIIDPRIPFGTVTGQVLTWDEPTQLFVATLNPSAPADGIFGHWSRDDGTNLLTPAVAGDVGAIKFIADPQVLDDFAFIINESLDGDTGFSFAHQGNTDSVTLEIEEQAVQLWVKNVSVISSSIFGNLTIDVQSMATDAILTMDGSSDAPGTLTYESDNEVFIFDKALNVGTGVLLEPDGTGTFTKGTSQTIIQGDTFAGSFDFAGGTNSVILANGTHSIDAVGDVNIDGLTTLSGNLLVNGGDIGITADTDLIQLASGLLTVNGNLLLPDDGYIGAVGNTTLIQLDGDLSEVIINGALEVSDGPITIAGDDVNETHLNIQNTNVTNAQNWRIGYFKTVPDKDLVFRPSADANVLFQTTGGGTVFGFYQDSVTKGVSIGHASPPASARLDVRQTVTAGGLGVGCAAFYALNTGANGVGGSIKVGGNRITGDDNSPYGFATITGYKDAGASSFAGRMGLWTSSGGTVSGESNSGSYERLGIDRDGNFFFGNPLRTGNDPTYTFHGASGVGDGILTWNDSALSFDFNRGATFNGNVRIGDTTTPVHALEVLGTVKTESGRIRNTTRYTTTQSIPVTDDQIYCNGTFTVTLPTGVDGQTFRIINSGTGTITITSSENIAGSTADVILNAGDIIILTFETTDKWW